jgi:glutathione S-transferase
MRLFSLTAIAMQYRSQEPIQRPRKLARRLLHQMREAQAMGTSPGADVVRHDGGLRSFQARDTVMAKATLTISSKNYSSWSLRGWLLTKFSGLEFDEIVTSPDDASAKAEILLLSSSILVPCLRHDGATVWDTLAIAEYLNEIMPEARLLPADRILRAHCRSISGEIHSGFTTLRASLPVNLKGHFPGFKIWSRAQADIDRICTIWRECLARSGGPFLFGERSMADAMYAPVVTRFMTYDVKLDQTLATYARTVMALPEMQQWIEAAKAEPADIEELEVEY